MQAMSPLPPPTRTVDLVARQIWAVATATSTLASNDNCYSYRIHSPNGTILLNNKTIIPLTQDAFLRPYCDGNNDDSFDREVLNHAILDVKDPWYSSTSPVLFVLAMCLTIAWVLLIMLLITPKTFFHAPTGYGIGQMRMGSAGGSIPIIGIGNRPWFQKVATFTVAVSLLLATVRAFDKAADQWNTGILDSTALTVQTLFSTEVLVIRFISSMFEWLAQAQTALRLFQRPREKVVIKWIALTLIVLEMVFGILDSFTKLGKQNNDNLAPTTSLRPRNFSSAIPAIHYLFEIALSLMYAAVVLYFSLTKRRYAYYHPKMPNISLVALLAIVAILVPVVFFILDISQPAIASWGDYVRWVGAAAASVLAWEWVERIEALERDERKDGILGREIFEGDELLDSGPGPDGPYMRGGRHKLDKTFSSSTTAVASSRDSGNAPPSPKRRRDFPRPKFPRLGANALVRIAALRQAKRSGNVSPNGGQRAGSPVTSADIEMEPTPRVAPPPPQERASGAAREGALPAAETRLQPPPVSPSPVSRSDCTSASTVYRVVHHPISPTSTPGISDTLYPQGAAMNIGPPSPNNNSKGKRRAVNMSNLNPFKRRHDARTPVTLETEEEEDEEEEGDARNGEQAANEVASVESVEVKERLDKPTKQSFFSRFRRDPSEEVELPPLVIPWRGDHAHTTGQDVDLESGLSEERRNGGPSHRARFMARSNSDAHIDPLDVEDMPRRATASSPRSASFAVQNFSVRSQASHNRSHSPSDGRRPP